MLMLILALLCAAVTAVVHGYIFYLEQPAYGSPEFERVFRLDEEQTAIMRSAFNNLAVYNLMIALAAVMGLLLRILAERGGYLHGLADGVLLVALGTAAAAGGYLAWSDADKRRAAAIQGVPALLGVIFLLAAL